MRLNKYFCVFATAVLLARLGVGQLALFDDDIVEVTNLNRLHGSRRADADASPAVYDELPALLVPPDGRTKRL